MLKQPNFLVYFQSQLMRVFTASSIHGLESHLQKEHFNIFGRRMVRTSTFVRTPAHNNCRITFSMLQIVSDRMMEQLKNYELHGHSLTGKQIPLNGNILKSLPPNTYYQTEVSTCMCLIPTSHIPSLRLFTDLIIESNYTDNVIYPTETFSMFQHMFRDLYLWEYFSQFENIIKTLSNDPYKAL